MAVGILAAAAAAAAAAAVEEEEAVTKRCNTFDSSSWIGSRNGCFLLLWYDFCGVL